MIKIKFQMFRNKKRKYQVSTRNLRTLDESRKKERKKEKILKIILSFYREDILFYPIPSKPLLFSIILRQVLSVLSPSTLNKTFYSIPDTTRTMS